ncbi:MAG TPA: Amuc_1099 family pilus-like system protein [Chthoniobacterales bacterium]
MNWIRANYDRTALIAAALFLFLSAVFIFLRAANFRKSIAGMQMQSSLQKQSAKEKAPEVEQEKQKLAGPAQWTFSGRSGLFVPEQHFIDASGQPTTLENTQLHPPVPNEWLEEFSLPITEGDVLDQDPDADGFNNLDEWQAHTNPIDKNSHADYITKLKMISLAQEPFRFVFSSWVGDTYAINTIDHRQPTQFLKIGETIRGTLFKLVKFKEKNEKSKFGTDVDVSELTLENAENKDALTLTKGKTTTSPESVANFLYTWGGDQRFSAKKGQEFSLKPQTEIKYKLIDVQPDKAILINTQKPNEEIDIGLLPP